MPQEQVSIDWQKCTGCTLCATICPYRVISMRDGVAQHSGAACFLCDHCRAVCPQGAITTPVPSGALGLVTMEESIGESNGPELVALMRSRRSCRTFLDTAVPLDMLLDLVKIGTTAPSGTNSQGWEFVILPSRADVVALGGLVADFYRKLNRMAANPLFRGLLRICGMDGLDRYYHNYFKSVAEGLREWDEKGSDRLFHGAPAVILVCGRKTASCPAEDALLATQNILLAAHAMGLGSCLIGFAVEAMRRTRAMKHRLAIAGDEEIYSAIALGFPAVTFLRPAGRRVVRPRIVRPALVS